MAEKSLLSESDVLCAADQLREAALLCIGAGHVYGGALGEKLQAGGFNALACAGEIERLLCGSPCGACRGTGQIDSRCEDPQCGDSTWDHFCGLGGTSRCSVCEGTGRVSPGSEGT